LNISIFSDGIECVFWCFSSCGGAATATVIDRSDGGRNLTVEDGGEKRWRIIFWPCAVHESWWPLRKCETCMVTTATSKPCGVDIISEEVERHLSWTVATYIYLSFLEMK
jgi:hypothetical protein